MTTATTTNPSQFDQLLISILRFGVFLCFAGWTWVHFYWDAPYGVLLWHDGTYEFANWLGIGWEEFVGSGANDGFVQKWIRRTGWLCLTCSVLAFTVRKGSWVQMSVLIAGSGLLTVLSYARYLESQCQLPMFIEHGGQMLMPVLLVLGTALGARHRLTVATAIVAFIMTFAGHGSYAVGLWPTPANFYGMISVIFQVDYSVSRAILRTAGVVDLLACIGILIPSLRRGCALYAATWGLLTAVARPVAGMSLGLNYWGADQFLHEAILRAPHYMIPLYLFILWSRPRSTEIPASQEDSGEVLASPHTGRLFQAPY